MHEKDILYTHRTVYQRFTQRLRKKRIARIKQIGILDVDPTVGIQTVVSRIKGKTSYVLNREFPELQRKLPTLWTRSKFIATVGSVSLDVVKQYIENQKGR